jgi:hypothetical protein
VPNPLRKKRRIDSESDSDSTVVEATTRAEATTATTATTVAEAKTATTVTVAEATTGTEAMTAKTETEAMTATTETEASRHKCKRTTSTSTTNNDEQGTPVEGYTGKAY